ncbi:MATE family efflux transporter [Frateuria aurantia]|uniref:Putative efflux protein, MATE family n=1 Tax=Frateuria aurantia (strain ATCC 33424 / DSM 6220 / KCTC 2777 / LMG 1558 / NBRC 3245 / NCIMB 13370) TaxID=767434 RepID=H8L286_FRAAD|nr:MATE family efflux transporter [Frateuria aurantia]AFC87594.1 putative efflux protein, MATE family [Frateuria aurantia DSM 6220]
MASRPSAPPSLTEGPIGRRLLMFSLPILASNILQSLNGSINAFWIGHYFGEAALLATGNVTLILFLALSAVFGIGMACTILVGQAMGARDMAAAQRVAGTGAVFFLAVASLFAVIGDLGVDAILRMLETPATSLPYAHDYLKVIFIAMPAMFFFTFLMMALRGAGDAKTPFLFMLLSVMLDIVLNPLLMFGWGPIPALGITGSATATLIGQSFSVLALLATLYHRRHPLCLRGPALAYLVPDPVIVKALVGKGLPMGLQMIGISSSAIFMMRLVNTYGTDTGAAYNAAVQLWTYVQMPAMAIGAAVSAMAAQNVGAGQWHRITQIARSGLLINLLLTGTLVIVIYLAGAWAMRLFLPAGSPAIAAALHLNAIVLWTFVLFGLTFILFGIVRSTGAVWPPLIILVIAMWLVRPPFAILLRPYWGVDAVWWSFPVGSVVAVGLAWAYYRWGHWRAAHMLPPSRLSSPLGERHLDGDKNGKTAS